VAFNYKTSVSNQETAAELLVDKMGESIDLNYLVEHSSRHHRFLVDNRELNCVVVVVDADATSE
jgi:hypothetical protein